MKNTVRIAGAVLFAFASVACQGASSALTAPTPSAANGTVSASSLVSGTWRLVEINGQGALPGTTVTAVFAGQNSLSGSAGCNRYAGTAATDNGRLTVGGFASTQMYCAPDSVMDQEAAYLSALEKATGYRVVGAELRLQSAAGATILVFVRD